MPKEIELDLIVLAQTASAYLVTDDDVEVWLPSSQIEFQDDLFGIEIGGKYSILIPEWLAIEKGLV